MHICRYKTFNFFFYYFFFLFLFFVFWFLFSTEYLCQCQCKLLAWKSAHSVRHETMEMECPLVWGGWHWPRYSSWSLPIPQSNFYYSHVKINLAQPSQMYRLHLGPWSHATKKGATINKSMCILSPNYEQKNPWDSSLWH